MNIAQCPNGSNYIVSNLFNVSVWETRSRENSESIISDSCFNFEIGIECFSLLTLVPPDSGALAASATTTTTTTSPIGVLFYYREKITWTNSENASIFLQDAMLATTFDEHSAAWCGIVFCARNSLDSTRGTSTRFRCTWLVVIVEYHRISRIEVTLRESQPS